MAKQRSKEQIEATANSIVNHFIPKKKETTLSFHFTIPPSSWNCNRKVETFYAASVSFLSIISSLKSLLLISSLMTMKANYY